MTEDGPVRTSSPRSDPHMVTARAIIESGEVGAPRTLRLGWSFSRATDPVDAAAELADVALWLLDAEPASLYALGDGGGPTRLHVNLLATNGALALLEATSEGSDAMPQRELHLLASDGEIVHRTGQDDLLWHVDGAEAFHALAAGDRATSQDGDRASASRILTISRAIAASLRQGETVVVQEEIAR